MRVSNFFKENREYFDTSKKEIALSNSKNLKIICIIYAIILMVYTIISIADKKSNLLLYLFIFFDIVHILLSTMVFLRKKEDEMNFVNTQVYCGIFECFALGFFLVENVFVFRDRDGIYTALIILAVIVAFAHKTIHIVGITSIYLIAFVILSNIFKTPDVFKIDLYVAIATMVTVGTCYLIISTVRQSESKLRVRIKEDAEKQRELLQIEKDAAIKANESKGYFLSQMSHDMRTPMNAIMGMTYLAKEEKPSPKVFEYLDNIDISTKYLTGLINDVLDLTKIECGVVETREEPYSLSDFIRGIDISIRPLMKVKNINFTMDLSCGLENIIVDRLRFNQVFYNLLSNAAKYTPEGGEVKFYEERIPSKNGKQGIRFYIVDNGIGISEEFIKIIFEPFTREHKVAVEQQKGAGLGLTIAKTIVEQMDGTIKVNSEPGKGTEFIIDIYVRTTTDIAKEDDVIYEDFSQLSGLHILIVDDNDLNRMIVEKILEAKNCIVDSATNGEEAIEMFTKSEINYYTVILMDIRMPVIDGYEATRRIRKLDRSDARSIQIFALTADVFNENVETSYEVGLNDHLAKPIDPKMLYNKIMNIENKGTTN